ncbi:MAG TPA: hypothetical protein VFO25_05575 [Candidatus Eremiobacteraceae bacterium]|nr:hypothetical protein [Candidatus Eremiobacteraceae bacterium]
MVHFRIFSTAAALAVLATTAIASAGPTPNDIGAVRPVAPVRHPVALVRHPVAVAPRPVVQRVNPRVNPDVSDDVLLARINRINHEDCAMVMRDRPDLDPAILAGIIEQRQAECERMHFDRGRHLALGQFRDADDRRFNAVRPTDVRDDRVIQRLRADDRRDDRRFSAPVPADRDDRLVNRLRADDRRDDRHMGPAHFAGARRFQTGRVASVSHGSRPMGRPRP